MIKMNGHRNCVPKRVARYLILPAVILISLLIGYTPPLSASNFTEPFQAFTVKGRIVGANLTPVSGASISEKGTQNTVVSDDNGNFTIDVKSGNAVLEITYVGYTSESIHVNGRSDLGDVALSQSVSNLDEVVVIGYGTARRQDLTAAISTVSSKDFLQGAINNPMQQIDGKVAGLTVSGRSVADPNASPDLQVRGAGSFRAGTSPLIVIDGMPGGDLRNLAPQDIESYSVLKDAASASIYGTRGANGVILITTKKGRSGKVVLDYEGWVDHDVVAKKPDILSTSEFLSHQRDQDFGSSTNWYDLLIRKDNIGYNHYLAASGGSDNSRFRIAGNYRSKQGIDIASDRKEYGVRANFMQKAIDGLLEIGGDMSLRYANEDFTDYDAFKQAIRLNPTVPLMDPNNPLKYNTLQGFDTYNPVQRLMTRKDGAEQQYDVVNLNLKLNITPYLNTELRLSRQGHNRKGLRYENADYENSVNGGYIGFARINDEQWRDYTLEWLGNYDKSFGKHDIKAVGGYSYNEQNYFRDQMQNRRFPNDYFEWNNIGTGNWNNGQIFNASDIIYSNRSKEKTIAFLARVMYNFDNTYFVTVSGRYEGNTKFGPNNKWGLFPSLSAAWRLTSLDAFRSVSSINDLKLRFSYGVTGRSGFDRYSSLSKYSPFGRYLDDNGQWIRVYGPGSPNPNPDLKWEKQHAYDAGIDFSLSDFRLSGSFDWFYRKGSDLINDYLVPVPPYLHDRMFVNVGDQVNKGVELTLNWKVINQTNFQYTASVAGSYTRSQLTKFSDEKFKADQRYYYYLPSPGNPGPAFRYQEGSYVGDFWGYKYAGVDDNGNILVYKTEDGKLTTEKINATNQAGDKDKVTMGNGVPKVELGWGNEFTYKDFDLSLFFKGKFGYQIFNLYQMYFGLQAEPGVNLLRDAYTRNGHIKSGKVITDYFLENGNYLRLDNATLGWTKRMDNSKLNSLRVYISTRNLFTLTKFTGLDPAAVNTTGLEPGINRLDLYPVTRTYTLGVNLNF